MMNLTDKEKITLIALVQNGLNSMGGRKPKDLLNDNFSWFKRGDITKATGFRKHVASGLMSSLEKKGLIADSNDGQEYDWFVTEEGINLVQEMV